MKYPLVSVLVPAFNDSQYLPSALGSLEKQTFRDFEVLISDDCSTDSTVKVAGKWRDKDDRIKIIHNPNNLGMTANWNSALNHANGKYIVKLDADDAMNPKCIEILADEMGAKS